MALKKWNSASGGAWAAAANWSPSGAPTSLDDAILTGPAGKTYQVVSGPGSSASLTLLGNTTLSGAFTTGALSVGSAAGAGALTIAAASTVTASTAALGGPVLVSGVGAKLAVNGALTLGRTYASGFDENLTVASGAMVQAGSVAGVNTINVDATSKIEIGTAGGAVAGKLTIDPGHMFSGSGVVFAAGGIVNNGTILAQGGSMGFIGPLTGSGTLQIGAGGTLSLLGTNNEAIIFNTSAGTLALTASAVFNEFGANTYTLSEGGVISGFAQGDAIAVNSSSLAPSGVTYQAGVNGTGTLTLTSGATSLGALTLAGNYDGKSFQVTPGYYAGSYNITLITAPSVGGTLSPGTTAPDAYNWIGTGSGNWDDAANWTDTTTGATLAAIAPGVNDFVTLTGLAGASYRFVSGPGNSAGLALLGNTALSGTFATGALSVGAAAGADAGQSALDIVAGSTVAASTAALGGVVQVSGAGAKLIVSGAMTLGGMGGLLFSNPLVAAAGAAIQAGSVAMLPLAIGTDAISVDASSTFEVGASGGASGGASVGKLTIDAGRVLSGAGNVTASLGIANAGTILAQNGSLSLNGAITGAGMLRIGAGGTLGLNGTNNEAIAFDDASGTLGLSVAPVFNGFGANAYTLSETGVIGGFVQGDTITVNSFSLAPTGVVYRAGPAGLGTLTLMSGGAALGTLTLAGNYTGKTFQVMPGKPNNFSIGLAAANVPQDPLFDRAYYLAHNPDVAAAGVDPYQHYLTQGWHEGRNPSAFFDTNYYLAQNPDVKAAGVDPLLHFEANGWREGRDPSLLFSDAKYLAANPDVKAARVDPLAQYMSSGQSEGRMAFLPGATAAADPLVNAAYYDKQLGATLIPAGAAGQQQAAASYAAAGWQKGLNPDAFFDTKYYLRHNPDVAAAHIDPLLHYEQNGWKEGRDPSAQFSTHKYLAAYSDVKAAGLDPLLHYVAHGQSEGRTAFAA